MELKELCEKTIRIFEIKSIDELSDALFHVCKTGEYDKIPKNCNECGMYYTSALGGFGCVVSHRFISENAANKRKKPDWCPIKPIPEKMKFYGEYPQPDGFLPSVKIGWNNWNTYWKKKKWGDSK